MPSWLLLLNDAGFPLFSRSFGLPHSAFSFPTMGLLSAAHSSAANSGFDLAQLQSQDGRVVCRTHSGGLIVVLASGDAHVDDESLRERAQRCYDALMMLVGRHKITDLRNVERTKRQIRVTTTHTKWRQWEEAARRTEIARGVTGLLVSHLSFLSTRLLCLTAVRRQSLVSVPRRGRISATNGNWSARVLYRIQSVSRHSDRPAHCTVRIFGFCETSECAVSVRPTHSECCCGARICSRVFDDIRQLAQSCNTLHAALYAQHRLYAWTDEWSADGAGRGR